jgi:hypothetical protein
MHNQFTRQLLRLMAMAALGGGVAIAGKVTIDFNSDPTLLNVFNTNADILGTGGWRPNYGASGKLGDGYMSITDAVVDQYSELVFNDLDNGSLVKAFTFDLDVRIGGGNSRLPGEGFSVNYCSADDPVVVNAAYSLQGGWSGTGAEPGTDNGGTGLGLPEEGTSTGIAVGFDEWQSGSIDGAQDVVGISLRVEGNLILQWPVPLSNNNVYYSKDREPEQLAGRGGGTTTTPYVYYYDPIHFGNPYNDLAQSDPNYIHSLQTGPRNPNAKENADPQSTDPKIQATWSWYLLSWEHLHLGVDAEGRLTLCYKGQTLTPTNGLPTTFAPRAGRVVFGGRTYSVDNNIHIDNLVLETTPADTAILGAASGYAAGFSLQVLDSGPSAFNPKTLRVWLNGEEVTANGNWSKTNGVTTFSDVLQVTKFLASGSTNAVCITGQDTRGVPISGTRSFVAPTYTTVPASYATAQPATGSGFNLSMTYISDQWQRNRNAYDTGGDINSVINAENQIVGGLWNPRTGAPVTNLVNQIEAPNNRAVAPFINFDYAGGDENGEYFNDTLPPDSPVPNLLFPGIDDNYANNFTMVATSFLHLKPGYYRLAVSSYGGFDFRISTGLGDPFGLLLGQYDGSCPLSETHFDFAVGREGDYPIRLAYGGGGNCEFYSVDIATGVRTLVNNPDPPVLAIAAHPIGHGTAAITSLSPYPGFNGVDLLQPVIATLVDDATTVNPRSISATLDGVSVTPVVLHNGSTTSVTIAPSTKGWAILSQHSGALIWSESNGTTHTNAFSFRTRALTPFDLPTNSFWIEAEDYNFNKGQIQADANVMPYLGGAYNQIGTGVYGVDYEDNNSQSSTYGSITRSEDNKADTEFVPTFNPSFAL